MALAVVLAGGSGSRMKSDVAKQYIKINDREVLYYPLYTFQNNDNILKYKINEHIDNIKNNKK